MIFVKGRAGGSPCAQHIGLRVVDLAAAKAHFVPSQDLLCHDRLHRFFKVFTNF